MEDYNEFISVDDLIIHYDLVPLLENKVQINEIILNSPVIHIIKDEQGIYNTQDLAVVSQESQKGQQFNVQSLSGKNWEVIIEDWVIKNGTFAFKDLQTKTAHSLSGFNAHFINLKFNDLTNFSSDFVVRNRIDEKITETQIAMEGKINLANFKTEEMALSDTKGVIQFLKKPIPFTLSLTDFTSPKIEATFSVQS